MGSGSQQGGAPQMGSGYGMPGGGIASMMGGMSPGMGGGMFGGGNSGIPGGGFMRGSQYGQRPEGGPMDGNFFGQFGGRGQFGQPGMGGQFGQPGMGGRQMGSTPRFANQQAYDQFNANGGMGGMYNRMGGMGGMGGMGQQGGIAQLYGNVPQQQALPATQSQMTAQAPSGQPQTPMMGQFGAL